MSRFALKDGKILLNDGQFGNQLSMLYRLQDQWQHLSLEKDGERFTGRGDGLSVHLALDEDQDSLTYTLALDAEFPTRVQLKLGIQNASEAFHLIPCCIHGDNNLENAEPGHFPNLTRQYPDNISCSPCWEFRADRASHPVSLLLFQNGLAGISIEPYSTADPAQTTSREGFIRNGVFSELEQNRTPHACGVTLGYGNLPVSFINKDTWGVSTSHQTQSASVSGRIFLREAASRLDAHQVIRQVYDDYHSSPSTPVDEATAADHLLNAFLTVNWQPEKEQFSNMHCSDAFGKHLTAWRTLPEIGWTGEGVIGYPLLISGHRTGNELAAQRADYLFNQVANAYNPASGLLWDVSGKHEGQHTDGWWAGYLVSGVHCAYTNGSGLYYLLKACDFLHGHGEKKTAWLDTARQALDTIVELQMENGGFGYTYNTEQPEILDPEGFAGVWFVPALALAYRHTRDADYLRAAERGIRFYRQSVQALSCCGTPMDTWKSPEEEGNLGFIRGARLLHEITGKEEYLEMLEEGAEYEYLWRYGFQARPEYPPLKGSHYHSCGGSVTSVSNPHQHPMALYISRELGYLADIKESEYHRSRREDGLRWGRNIVSLYPDVSGYGTPGVLTERFCPSDGLTIETFPDGTPSSMWFSYNGWAAAAVLEALTEALLDSNNG